MINSIRENIKVIQGDITMLDVDIIVNAANNSLLGGGVVDGKIHYMAGPRLREECMRLGGCKDGEAKMTDAYNIPCRKIIHTVGPIYKNGRSGEEQILKNCYVNCMMLAERYRISNNFEQITIAFPCISTGAFGYPKDQACSIAINTIENCKYKNINVIFVCYDEFDYKLYINKLNGLEKNYCKYN